MDQDGKSRLVSNDKQVVHGTVKTKYEQQDKVLLDVVTHQVIYNFDENNRDTFEKISKKIAINNHRTVYPIDCDYHLTSTIKGRRYKDINNDSIYVIRFIPDVGYLYMNLNAKFIRYSDIENNNNLDIICYLNSKEENDYNKIYLFTNARESYYNFCYNHNVDFKNWNYN